MSRQTAPTVLGRIEALPIVSVFVVLLVLFMYLTPEVFLRPFQYTTFLSTLPPILLLAVGLTFIIGAGEIDLCFPAIIGFSGFTFAVIFKEGPAWVAAPAWLSGPSGWSVYAWTTPSTRPVCCAAPE